MKAVILGITCLAPLVLAMLGCASNFQASVSAPAPVSASSTSPASVAPSASRNTPVPSQASDQINSDQLYKVVRMQPVVYSSEFVGFRLYPGRERERFLCHGLQPGDLLQSIDGVPLKGKLSSSQELVTLMEQITQSFNTNSRLALQVLRGTEPNVVSLNFPVQEHCGAASR